MAGKTHRWKDIKDRNKTPEQLAALDAQVQQELDLMILNGSGQAAQKTQAKSLEPTETTQGKLIE